MEEIFLEMKQFLAC